jgi:WD40 repeat protein
MRILLFLCFLVTSVCLQAQKPELITSLGHSGTPWKVSFDSSSSYLLSTVLDEGASFLWDTESGKIIKTFPAGNGTTIYSASFSKGGKYIARMDSDSSLTIIETGSWIIKYRIKLPATGDIDFAPDDEYFVLSVFKSATAWCYHTATGQLVRKIDYTGKLLSDNAFHSCKKIGSSYKIYSYLNNGDYSFSDSLGIADVLGQYCKLFKAIQYSEDGHWIIRLDSGKCTAINPDNPGETWSISGMFQSAVVNPANNLLLTVTAKKHIPQIWEIPTGKLVGFLEYTEPGSVIQLRSGSSIAFSGTGKYIIGESMENYFLWDTGTGQLLDSGRSDRAGLYNAIQNFFDSKDQYLATVSAKTGSLITLTPLPVIDDKLYLRSRIDFLPLPVTSNEGNLFAIGLDSMLQVVDAMTGKPVFLLNDSTGQVGNIQYYNSQPWIAWQTNKQMQMVSLNTGKQVFSYHAKGTASLSYYTISSDGRQLAIMQDDGIIALYNLPSFKLTKLISSGKGFSYSPIPNIRWPDRFIKVLAFLDGDQELAIVDTGTLRIYSLTLKKFTSSMALPHMSVPGEYEGDDEQWYHPASVQYGGQGYLATTDPGGKTVIWCKTDKGYRPLRKPCYGRVLFTRNGATFLHHEGHKFGIYSTASGKELDTLYRGLQYNIHWRSGRLALYEGQSVSIYDPQQKKYLQHYVLSPEERDGIILWNKGNLMLCLGSSFIAIRNATDGRLLYRYYPYQKNDYLITDSLGRYDGSEEAINSIYASCGRELIELPQFREMAWEPGLAAKMTGANTERIEAGDIGTLDLCNQTPVISYLGTPTREHYAFKIKARMGGIGTTKIFINDKLIKTDSVNITTVDSTYQVVFDRPAFDPFLVSGEYNRLTVKATTIQSGLTSKVKTVKIFKTKSSVPPKLYSICVGISAYSKPQLKLNFAAKDAEVFNETIKAAATKFLGKENVINYLFTTNADTANAPTKKNIQAAFQKVAATATADDIILVFLSGHGVMINATKQFYYLTVNSPGFAIEGVEKEVAVSTDELNEWLRTIKAKKEILILDACNSGQIVDGFIAAKNLPANQERALEQLRAATGLFILAASAAGKPSFEMSQYDQGILTYSLLEGIKHGAALLNQNEIDISKWFQFAARHVTELSKDIEDRQYPKIVENTTFTIGMVDEAIKNAIPTSVTKPIFGAAQLIETNSLTDDLFLMDSIHSVMQDLSWKPSGSPLLFLEDYKGNNVFHIIGLYSKTSAGYQFKISLQRGSKIINRINIKRAASNLDGLTKEIINFAVISAKANMETP